MLSAGSRLMPMLASSPSVSGFDRIATHECQASTGARGSDERSAAPAGHSRRCRRALAPFSPELLRDVVRRLAIAVAAGVPAGEPVGGEELDVGPPVARVGREVRSTGDPSTRRASGARRERERGGTPEGSEGKSSWPRDNVLPRGRPRSIEQAGQPVHDVDRELPVVDRAVVHAHPERLPSLTQDELGREHAGLAEHHHAAPPLRSASAPGRVPSPRSRNARVRSGSATRRRSPAGRRRPRAGP